jgi:hypothetical protein
VTEHSGQESPAEVCCDATSPDDRVCRWAKHSDDRHSWQRAEPDPCPHPQLDCGGECFSCGWVLPIEELAQRAEQDPSTERSEGQPNTAAIRAEHEAHNYRVSALSSPHDCDGCGAEDAAKWDVLWFNEDRDEEPFLCDDCLAREFREIRLCDALDAARAQVANAEARIDAVREAVDEFSAYGQISVDRILGALGGTDD